MLGNINSDMSARETLKTICKSYYHYSINHEEEIDQMFDMVWDTIAVLKKFFIRRQFFKKIY